jgi:ATP-dependent RNA helicase DbpA
LLKKDAALPELKEFEASDAGVCHEEVFKKHRSLDAKMATLFIGGGRKQKVRPADLLGALTGEAGRLSAQDVGKIEIHDHFSYVAVSENLIDVILKRLRNGLIKGKRFRIERAR